MIKRKRTSDLAALLTLATIALCGCAVVTVDVDVYKGPLANQESVQVEQISVAAIGAQPILQRLQYELIKEFGLSPNKDICCSKKKNGETKATDKTEDFNNSGADTTLGDRLPENPQTSFYCTVEEILALYEENSKDRVSKRGLEAAKTIVELYQNSLREAKYYSDAKVILDKADQIDTDLLLEIEGSKSAKDESVLPKKSALGKLIERIRILEEMKPNLGAMETKLKEDTSNLVELKEKKTNEDDPNKAKALAAKIMELQKSIVGDEKQINDIKSLEKLIVERKTKEEELKKAEQKQEAWERLANAYKQLLSEPRPQDHVYRDPRDIAVAHNAIADEFGLNRLKENVGPTSPKSYTDSHRFISDNRFVITEHAEILLGKKSRLRTTFVSRVMKIADSFLQARASLEQLLVNSLKGLEESSDVRWEKVKEGEDIVKEVAEFSSKIIHGYWLGKVLDGNDHLQELKAALIKIMKEADKDVKKDVSRVGKKEDAIDLKGAILTLLTSNPAKFAPMFLYAHRLSKAQKGGYGITTGPGADGDDIPQIKGREALESITRVNPTTKVIRASQLSNRGRLNEGLLDLIEAYLDASDQLGKARAEDRDLEKSERELEYARNRLFDALVRFANKLRTIANYQVLLDSGSSVGKDRETLITYTRVLQAVGNSILNHIDALRDQQLHQRNLEDQFQSELLAMQRSLNPPPGETLNRLVAAIDAKKKQLQAEHSVLAKSQNNSNNLFNAAKIKFDSDGVKIAGVPNYSGFEFQVQNHVANQQRMAANMIVLKGKPNLPKPVVNIKSALDVVKSNAEKKPKARAQLYGTALRDLYDNHLSKDKRETGGGRQLDAAAKFFETIPSGALSNDASTSAASDQAVRKYIENQLGVYDKSIELAKAVQSAHQSLAKVSGATATKKTKVDSCVAASAVIRTVAGEIRGAITTQKPTLTPSGVHALLQKALVDRQSSAKAALESSSAETDKTKKQNALQAATDAVGKFKEVPVPTDPVDLTHLANQRKHDGKPSSALDVIEQLIKIYEYEQITETKAGGVQSTRAIQTAQAVKASFDKRARMVHLRSAMAYLRDSMPATDLANTTGQGWQNMLGQHGLRQIPFTNLIQNKNARMLDTLDKRFWQNINRVRVAGGGITNYVIAKDDIGNWYVKNYSADPAPIIKSAQKLALFSMGPQMGADLIGRLETRESVRQRLTNLGQDPNDSDVFQRAYQEQLGETPGRTGLRGRQFTAAEARFESATSKAHRDAESKTGELVDDVKEVWSSNDQSAKLDVIAEAAKKTANLEKATFTPDPPADNVTAAAASAAGVDNTTPTPTLNTKKRVEEITRGLRTMRAFHAAVIASIHNEIEAPAKKTKSENETIVADLEAKKKAGALSDAQNSALAAANVEIKDADKEIADGANARRLITELIGTRVNSIVQARRDAIGQLESAIAVIGEGGS